MPGRRHQSVAIAGVSLCLLSVAAARAELTIQDPGTYVIDRAGVISEMRINKTEELFGLLEQHTTAQVKLLTIQSTEGEDFFGFVQRHAELWKLGQKGKDNGALIVISVKDRQIRIQTGYGLEEALPDAWCAAVSADAAQHFKASDYTEGVVRLTVATANEVAAYYGVTLPEVPEFRIQPPRVPQRTLFCGGGFVPLIILIIIVSSLSRRQRYYRHWGGGGLWSGLFWGMMLGNMMGGRRAHWGGGYGGGLGRGFGGGFGGGSFGRGGSFGGGGGGASW